MVKQTLKTPTQQVTSVSKLGIFYGAVMCNGGIFALASKKAAAAAAVIYLGNISELRIGVGASVVAMMSLLSSSWLCKAGRTAILK